MKKTTEDLEETIESPTLAEEEYFFPEWEITVKATSREEAEEKAQALAKKKGGLNG